MLPPPAGRDGPWETVGAETPTGARPLLNEKQRRVVACSMAVALGLGGQVRVVEATGRLSTRRLGQGTLPRQIGQLDGMCV
jgi:hypothetical protein